MGTSPEKVREEQAWDRISKACRNDRSGKHADDVTVMDVLARSSLLAGIKRRDTRESTATLLWFLVKMSWRSWCGEGWMYKTLPDLQLEKGFTCWKRPTWETSRRALVAANESLRDSEKWYKEEPRELPDRSTAMHYWVNLELVEMAVKAVIELEAAQALNKRRRGLKPVEKPAAQSSESSAGGTLDSSAGGGVNPARPSAGIQPPDASDSSTPSFLMHEPTSETDFNNNSHSLVRVVNLARESGEGEKSGYVFSLEEQEAAINSLAEELIEIQRKVSVLISANDRKAAFEVARGAIEAGTSRDRLIEVSKSTFVKMLSRPNQIKVTWSAAIHFIGAELGRSVVAEHSREEIRKWAANGAAERERQRQEQLRREQQRQAQEQEKAERFAEQQRIREQEARDRAALLRRQLIEYSAGRLNGVSESSEASALDNLLRLTESFESLRAAFDWCAVNRDSSGPLGWSVVDARYQEWCKHEFNKLKKQWTGKAPAGRRRTESAQQAARIIPMPVSNAVFRTMLSVCGFTAEPSTEQDRADLNEAFESYRFSSRRLSEVDQIAELELFAEWFHAERRCPPRPLEIRERLAAFRGQ